MEIKEYEYSRIEFRRIKIGEYEYTFEYTQSKEYSLLDILNDIGRFGWMFVGEVDGQLIVMKEKND